MLRDTGRSRPFLRIAAVLFAAATVLYSALWMYVVRLEARSALGIRFDHEPASIFLVVNEVVPGSGAAEAGVQPGDRVRAIDGAPLEVLDPLRTAVTRGRPGDVVRLTIDRPGWSSPMLVPVVLGPPPAPVGTVSPARTVALQLIGSFPIVFLAVGLVVLFLRLEDRNAWLVALLFACFIASAPILNRDALIHHSLRGFAVAFKVIFNGLFGALFYYFCSVFPVPSALDRRAPWLKTLLMGAGAAAVVPLGAACLLSGDSRFLFSAAEWVGPTAVTVILSTYFFGTTAVALTSLVWNGLRASTTEARRRIRVIVWGTLVGVTPFMLLQAAAVASDRNPYDFPFPVWTIAVLAVLLLPVSFAYAVIKHRVMEIPLLLKRGARYLLVQRGFTILLVVASAAATLLFAAWTSDLLDGRLRMGVAPGISLGAAFGILLVWAGTRVSRRVTQRIDRAFFRSAYDARQILHALSERTATAGTREELGDLLAGHIDKALHPASLTIYLEARSGLLQAVHGAPAAAAGGIPRDHPALLEAARLGRPLLLDKPAAAGSLPRSADGLPQAEYLVPLVGRDQRLVGALLLGERLSEEPYSGEDRRLLSSAASQAALALQNVLLAEQMAERLEAERRVAVELELAKEVQSRLLPRHPPPLRTLDCAGDCLQARSVGGDYYDFLELGGGQTGLVLADIAGKGIAGALSMASLQAHLRAHSGLAREDLRRLLRGLNAALCETMGPGRFATLFFGCYDDRTHLLRYANCGHNPPLLIRVDDRVERLTATATILGTFETWDCEVAEIALAPGDALVMYSDGITEATGSAGEEFGEGRLLEAARRHRHGDAAAMIAGIIRAVQGFGSGDQADDMTIVAGLCRSEAGPRP